MSKFSDSTCEALYNISLECGDCSTISTIGEWYGLLVNTGIEGAEHAILFENDQGFVEYSVFDSEDEARKEFERIEGEIAGEDPDSSEDEWNLDAALDA